MSEPTVTPNTSAGGAAGSTRAEKKTGKKTERYSMQRKQRGCVSAICEGATTAESVSFHTAEAAVKPAAFVSTPSRRMTSALKQ